MKPSAQAAVAQMILTAYLQVIEWIPLPPWNDLSRGNGQATMDVALLIGGIAFAVSTWRRKTWLMILATIGYAGWLALQVQTWWVPYFTGGSAGWRRVYERWFSNTFRFLPPINDHPVPDAAHTVLHLLLMIVLVMTIRAIIAERRR
jgi:hypothetical protein